MLGNDVMSDCKQMVVIFSSVSAHRFPLDKRNSVPYIRISDPNNILDLGSVFHNI